MNTQPSNKSKCIRIKVPPDGNCFFHCLNLYLLLVNDELTPAMLQQESVVTFQYTDIMDDATQRIRNSIFVYIQNDEKMLDYLCTMGYENNEEGLTRLQNEVTELRKNATYEIPLFDFFPIIVATLYRLKVYIYPVSYPIEQDSLNHPPHIYLPIDADPNYSYMTIHLLYVDAIHYELLVSKKFFHTNEMEDSEIYAFLFSQVQ